MKNEARIYQRFLKIAVGSIEIEKKVYKIHRILLHQLISSKTMSVHHLVTHDIVWYEAKGECEDMGLLKSTIYLRLRMLTTSESARLNYIYLILIKKVCK